MTKSKIQTKGQGCLIMWRQPENGERLWAGGVTWRQAVAASRRDKEQILPEWRMLHGVQGLAPARGRRRNACAGGKLAMGSLKARFHFQAAYLLCCGSLKSVWVKQ
ncbi:hypothetical protein [Kingella oralis]|uniref:hypothetical protein n=1 Tax=Kingella oralis TaxID=505 RepID=UPI0034E385E7